MVDGNGSWAPGVIIRWVFGGACSAVVIYGYFLMGAIHDVRDEVIRLSARIDQAVPVSQEIRDIDRLEVEISKKADAEGIRDTQANLQAHIDELNRKLEPQPKHH